VGLQNTVATDTLATNDYLVTEGRQNNSRVAQIRASRSQPPEREPHRFVFSFPQALNGRQNAFALFGLKIGGGEDGLPRFGVRGLTYPG
jgi:hypothetical protein